MHFLPLVFGIVLTSLFFIESEGFVQVAAGAVVLPFVSREGSKIPLPPNSKATERFADFEVCGDSLRDRGIEHGDRLTCRLRFNRSDIRFDSVVIIRFIHSNEYAAKMVSFRDGVIVVRSAHPDYAERVFGADEIEILALAVEVRRKL